jgi:hypothetical protein
LRQLVKLVKTPTVARCGWRMNGNSNAASRAVASVASNQTSNGAAEAAQSIIDPVPCKRQ